MKKRQNLKIQGTVITGTCNFEILTLVQSNLKIFEKRQEIDDFRYEIVIKRKSHIWYCYLYFRINLEKNNLSFQTSIKCEMALCKRGRVIIYSFTPAF